MGAFIHSIAVKTSSRKYLFPICDEIPEPAYIGDPIDGWVPVFPETYGEFEFAQKASEKLNTVVLVGITHDSDDLYFQIHDKGKKVFEYEYTPTFSSNLGVIITGNISTLNDYSSKKKDEKYIKEVLTAGGDKYVFQEERYRDILKILDMPESLSPLVYGAYDYIDVGNLEEEIKKDMPSLARYTPFSR